MVEEESNKIGDNYRENINWINSNEGRNILRQYFGRWVVVYEKKVVLVASSRKTILSLLEILAKEEDKPMGDYVVDYMKVPDLRTCPENETWNPSFSVEEMEKDEI